MVVVVSHSAFIHFSRKVERSEKMKYFEHFLKIQFFLNVQRHFGMATQKLASVLSKKDYANLSYNYAKTRLCWIASPFTTMNIGLRRIDHRKISVDKFDLLWIDLLQTCLKRVFSIMHQLNFLLALPSFPYPPRFSCVSLSKECCILLVFKHCVFI